MTFCKSGVRGDDSATDFRFFETSLQASFACELLKQLEERLWCELFRLLLFERLRLLLPRLSLSADFLAALNGYIALS